jgi:NAD(P)-dependent dehydrogenase (short-subunit alcohol dehydrogenase family)
LAREFLARHRRLDVVVNYAGALFAHRRESLDGIEMTLGLNHLAYFLLTNLLPDTLRAGAPARVVNVSSRAHEDVPGLDFGGLQARAGARRFWVYGDSQVAGLLFTLLAPMRPPAPGGTPARSWPTCCSPTSWRGGWRGPASQ